MLVSFNGQRDAVRERRDTSATIKSKSVARCFPFGSSFVRMPCVERHQRASTIQRLPSSSLNRFLFGTRFRAAIFFSRSFLSFRRRAISFEKVRELGAAFLHKSKSNSSCFVPLPRHPLLKRSFQSGSPRALRVALHTQTAEAKPSRQSDAEKGGNEHNDPLAIKAHVPTAKPKGDSETKRSSNDNS